MSPPCPFPGARDTLLTLRRTGLEVEALAADGGEGVKVLGADTARPGYVAGATFARALGRQGERGGRRAQGVLPTPGGDHPDDPDRLRFRLLGATNPEDFAQVKVKNAAMGAGRCRR